MLAEIMGSSLKTKSNFMMPGPWANSLGPWAPAPSCPMDKHPPPQGWLSSGDIDWSALHDADDPGFSQFSPEALCVPRSGQQHVHSFHTGNLSSEELGKYNQLFRFSKDRRNRQKSISKPGAQVNRGNKVRTVYNH